MLPSYLVFMSNHKIKKQKMKVENGVEKGIEMGRCRKWGTKGEGLKKGVENGETGKIDQVN